MPKNKTERVAMDGEEDERAEAELAALTLYHQRQLEQKQKLVRRIPSMVFKALLIAITVTILPSVPVLINYLRRALLTRTWDIVNLILVGLAVFYGVLSRGRTGFVEPDRESDGGDSYVAKLFEFGGSFADYVDPGGIDPSTANVGGGQATESPLKLPGRSLSSSVSDQDLTEETSDPRRASDDIDLESYGRIYPSPGAGIGKSEVNFGSPLVSENILRRHSAPPPPPARAISVENHRPTPKDSNPGPRPEEPQRKPPILPPPPPALAVETPLPPRVYCGDNVGQIATGTENLGRREKTERLEKKLGKSEKSEKTIPSPPPLPPSAPSGVPLKHGRSKSKEDSKHRSKDESKHRNANALGLFSQSERKQAKIPSPPAPPPLPSALQQWFSSYRRDSKHRSKDSEPSPRPRSERTSRKVHSSSSPPSPPPLPRLPPVYYVDEVPASNFLLKPTRYGASASKESSKSRRDETSGSKDSSRMTGDGASASKGSSKSRRDETSGSRDLSRMTRDGASASKGSSKSRRDETSGSKDSSRTTRDGASGSKEPSKPRMDESPGIEESSKPRMDESPGIKESSKHRMDETPKDSSKAAGDGTSGIRDSSKPRKEDMMGAVPDVKAGEKFARRKSTSIPLPPPPPPPFAMGEEHWPLYDLPKHQKTNSSPVVLWEESAASEPEPAHDPEPVITRQLSLDNTESRFCPSPSPDEVNRKADAFIARFHEQIRLQRMNSIRDRLDRGPR